MKQKKILIASLLGVLLLLMFIPFMSAGFLNFDWILGRATQPTNVSLTISALSVNWVSAIISPQNVTESGMTTITFYFTGTLPNGNVSFINDSTAMANFTNGGGKRENLSCSWLEDLDINPGDGTDDTANYSCTIDLWYWDAAGSWTVSASVADINGNYATNSSTSFTLSESTCFVTSPNALSWGSIVPGATNQTSTNDPSLLNNTCNDNIDSGNIDVKAIDLHGQSNDTYFIDSANFTVDIETGGALCSGDACVECDGVALQNDTYQAVTGASLPAGNNSAGQGQEQIYYCLTNTDTSLISQVYSTNKLGSWMIQIA